MWHIYHILVAMDCNSEPLNQVMYLNKNIVFFTLQLLATIIFVFFPYFYYHFKCQILNILTV